MYAQTEKQSGNKSKAVANFAAQKKSNTKQDFRFIDNRPEAITQKKLLSGLDDTLQLKTSVNYVDDFAAKHIYVGATDQQAIARAASRPNPANDNHVLTDTDDVRDTAFEDKLTTECQNEKRAAGYGFAVNVNAKKASKVRNDPNPTGGSRRKYAGNYDLIAKVSSVTAVLSADMEQNADSATIETVKD